MIDIMCMQQKALPFICSLILFLLFYWHFIPNATESSATLDEFEEQCKLNVMSKCGIHNAKQRHIHTIDWRGVSNRRTHSARMNQCLNSSYNLNECFFFCWCFGFFSYDLLHSSCQIERLQERLIVFGTVFVYLKGNKLKWNIQSSDTPYWHMRNRLCVNVTTSNKIIYWYSSH